MPLYEYHCTSCNKNTELLQKMDDTPEKTCPHCKKETLIKQISATQFQLKGSGWYVTDFKNKKETQQPSTPEKTKKTEQTETTETPKIPDTKTSEKTD